MKVVVTGANGLIGWHAHVRLHAANCGAIFRGEAAPYDIAALDHAGFDDDATLAASLDGAAAVLHFAGVNRGEDETVERANIDIAERLARFCAASGARPQIVYANSTHATRDTAYGRSKRIAGEALAEATGCFTDLILPHIFGEGARPNYNNVTATLIDALWSGRTPEINPDGAVDLLHAGEASQIAIDAAVSGRADRIAPGGRHMTILALWEKLSGFHALYGANVYPDLTDPFDVALFNSYRAAGYPNGWPRPLHLHSDARGTLFEAVKGGGGGQTFLSTTAPGVTRGDHFHLSKVERFLVLEGDAMIRIRKVLSDDLWEYPVTGTTPSAIDMPTLHTHSIENVGEGPLLTLFWTHDLFDPAKPDTYADRVVV